MRDTGKDTTLKLFAVTNGTDLGGKGINVTTNGDSRAHASVLTLKKCARRCLATPRCKAFVYEVEITPAGKHRCSLKV